jgi:hypothetical protein
VPLTDFQRALLAVLSQERRDDSYLAGCAALHFAPNSQRFSDDLDYFHDSIERVAKAFHADSVQLESAGYAASVELSQPGFIRATVSREQSATRVDWAHDTAWRFMPLVRDPLGGLLLHPIDLAINKLLALAGREEPRDFVDILFIHDTILPLGALVWATVGKDPGFTPYSLLELLKRRGHGRPEAYARLNLAAPFDLARAKEKWRESLAEADAFVRRMPPEEIGCLYYSRVSENFVMPPTRDDPAIVPHFGMPGGVLPKFAES